MSDLNTIFGYQVYKPPPEQDLFVFYILVAEKYFTKRVEKLILFFFFFAFWRPIIEDLNVHGELVTLIDPSADVIQDPAVQKIFKSMDGERTVVSVAKII